MGHGTKDSLGHMSHGSKIQWVTWVMGRRFTGSHGSWVKDSMGHIGRHGSKDSMGHIGHRSKIRCVTWVMGRKIQWVTWVMGRRFIGSHGSSVEASLGHMGRGS